jgi:hypothetical protein
MERGGKRTFPALNPIAWSDPSLARIYRYGVDAGSGEVNVVGSLSAAAAIQVPEPVSAVASR